MRNQVKEIIHFHGVTLLVVSHNGKDYVMLRPIVEMLSLSWKSARSSAFSEENTKLLGTCELNQPETDTFSPTSMAKKAVYILLEATEGYIFNTNTAHMRAKGNAEGADYVLSLKKEWQRVLHDYETKGIAYKNKTAADLKTYTELRNKTTISEERECYTQLIKHCFIELGVDAGKEEQSSAQQSLNV